MYAALFFLILGTRYLASYLMWGDFYVHQHDNLDSDIVYNKVIGDFYRSGFDPNVFNIFLNGTLKWYYFIRVLQPIILVYAIFTAKTAYFLTEVFVTSAAYFSMLSFLGTRAMQIKTASLFSMLFAFSLSYTTYGLGVACFPYILKQISTPQNLDCKTIFWVACIGVNSLLAMHVIFYPALFLLAGRLCQIKVYYSRALIVLAIMLLASSLTSSGLIFAQFDGIPTHRSLWVPDSFGLAGGIGALGLQVLTLNDYYHSYITPIFYCVPLILVGLLSQNRAIKKNAIFLAIFFGLVHFLRIYGSLLWLYMGPLKSIQLDRLGLFSGIFLIIYSERVYKSYTSYYLKWLLILMLGIYSIYAFSDKTGTINFLKGSLSIDLKARIKEMIHESRYLAIPNIVFKDVGLFEGNEYKQMTFGNYYRESEYECIKSFTGNSKAISIGIDPMIAVFNGIPVIDGYHNLYPASYKQKFRVVIENQIHGTPNLQYYDDWGSRVYSFAQAGDAINLNFSEAKKIGADFVIAHFPISHNAIEQISLSCDAKDLFLYKIK
ncbi:hypothetical protein G6728_01750 [Polynucleobacter paneuropaeus]|nr:hypothetical protein G6728_01750 [Polynucleobacter paneuropaeus]